MKKNIIPINVEKLFEKNQHFFMIKSPNKAGTEGNNLNIIKVAQGKTVQ
jgi:hypothetical protein